MPSWVSSPVHRKIVSVLIDARKAAGLTQRQLAARIGKPPSFVAKIELRERNLSALEFIGIAVALNMAPDVLMASVCEDLPADMDF